VSGIGIWEAGLVVIVFLGLFYIPLIFYVLTLRKALSQCSPGSRTLSPGLVWLLLIPLFGLIWHFVIVVSLAKSLHNEFVKRNISEDQNPGLAIGLATCILPLLGVVPHVRGLGLAALICWIVYWVKIAGYSARLEGPAGPQVS